MRAPTCRAAAMVLSSIGSASPFQLRYPGGFAPCTITLAPAAAARTDSVSIASPFTHSMRGSGDVRAASSGRRCSARTFHPRARSATAVSPPTPPVAPITNAVRSIAVHLEGQDDADRRSTKFAKRAWSIYIFVEMTTTADRTDPGWDLYRSFLAVFREGSLSGAARALDLTQPTIGRHVDALEAALGAPLFTRSQNGLRPTPGAAALVPHVEAMASAAGALRR